MIWTKTLVKRKKFARGSISLFEKEKRQTEGMIRSVIEEDWWWATPDRQNHERRTAWATIIGPPSDFVGVMSASNSSSVLSPDLFPDFPLTVHIILLTVCILSDQVRVFTFSALLSKTYTNDQRSSFIVCGLSTLWITTHPIPDETYPIYLTWGVYSHRISCLHIKVSFFFNK